MRRGVAPLRAVKLNGGCVFFRLIFEGVHSEKFCASWCVATYSHSHSELGGSVHRSMLPLGPARTQRRARACRGLVAPHASDTR